MLKFLKVTFFVFILAVVALIGGVYYVLHNFNNEEYKSKIEQIATKTLNREVNIGGDISIALSLIPTIEINDITIGNPDWAVSPYFLKTQKVNVSFAILPLLHKEIKVDNISIIAPDLNLEVAKNGMQNWNFALADKVSASDNQAKINDTQSAPETQEIAAVSLGGFLISQAELLDGKISYNDVAKKQQHTLILNKISSDYLDNDSNLGAQFDIQYEQYKVSGHITTATLEQLMGNGKNLPLNAQIKINNLSANFAGTVSELSENAIITGSLDLKNPAKSFNLPSIDLVAKINADTKQINADISKLDIAKNIITGKMSANIASKIPYVTANINSKLIKVQNLTAAENLTYFPAIIATAQAQESFNWQQPVDYSVLKQLNADVKLSIDKLVINEDMDIDGITANAKLNNGILNLKPLVLKFGDGQIDSDIVVDANQQTASLNLSSKNLKIQNVFDTLQLSDDKHFVILSGGNMEQYANLSTKGRTYAELLNNANGQIVTVVNKSKVRMGQLKILSSNLISQISQALQIYKPKESKMTLNCAVVHTDIKNGVAMFPKGIAVDTNELTIISSGTLNLQTQAIDFSLKPSGKKVSNSNLSQAISSLIRVKGTLQDPKLGIDDAGAIKTLVGIVTTGPVMLGSQMLLDGDDAPCHSALAGTKFANYFPAATGVKSNTKKAYNATSDAVSSGINAVTGTAGDILKGTAGGLLNMVTGNTSSKKKAK